MALSFDLVVIGGGPGGYVAALRARRSGLKVALVEKEKIGGICLNRGCIPTKTLLHHAEGILWMRECARNGIIQGEPAVDVSALMRHKDQIVGAMVSNLLHLVEGSGIRVIHGAATVPEPGIVAVDRQETIAATNIIVATGSRSWAPPIPGADLPGVLNTRQILQSNKIPARLTIIGAGMIGQEFACIYAALGVKVTILEALDRVLNEVDSDMAKRYLTTLPGKGIECETGCRIHRIEETGSGLRIVYEKGNEEKTLQTDQILMATGRRPDLGGCGVDGLGIRMEKGAVVVDEFLRTSIPGIWAVGDVLGRTMLAHVASYHGEIVVENILGRQKSVRDRIVPSCAYTFPQIAWVGLTEDAAKAAGLAFRTSIFPLSANGKAFSIDQPTGWVKVLEDTDTGRLVGIHMMGPHVSELLGEAALAISKGLSAADLVDTIHPHPTVSEALREAALGFCGGPVHAAPRIRTFARR
jgi:dihydrolipoamide dehydrogenase